MRYDSWARATFFTSRMEASSWANRTVGAARSIVAPLPEVDANDMRNLASLLRQCADDLEAVAAKGGDTMDQITAMAAGE